MKLLLALAVTSACLLSAAEPLITRSYKIDPTKLDDPKLEKQAPDNISAKIQSFVKATGIAFPAKDAQSPDTKAYFFSESKNLLTVRATPAELTKIETLLTQVTKAPPQVSLESKFAEVSAADTRAFELTIGKAILTAHTNQPFSTGLMTQPQFRVAIQALKNREGVDLLSAPTVTTLSGRQARISVEETKVNLFQTPPPRPRRATPGSPITPTTPDK